MPMATKFCRMVTYLDGVLSIKSRGCFITCLSRSRDKQTPYTSTTRVSMATKFDRMVT